MSENRCSSHFDSRGRARMVDVGAKAVTARMAVARGRVCLSGEALEAVLAGDVRKGDVLGVARIAGIQAAKRTSDWIPLAHPLPVDSVEVHFRPLPQVPAIEIEAHVGVRAKTGVEMEALVAVSAAGLTIYDMCKSIDRGMRLEEIRLIRKRGGKSGDYAVPEPEETADTDGEKAQTLRFGR